MIFFKNVVTLLIQLRKSNQVCFHILNNASWNALTLPQVQGIFLFKSFIILFTYKDYLS